MREFNNINRFEVIGKGGRAFVKSAGEINGLKVSMQDGGKTMKVFLNEAASESKHKLSQFDEAVERMFEQAAPIETQDQLDQAANQVAGNETAHEIGIATAVQHIKRALASLSSEGVMAPENVITTLTQSIAELDTAVSAPAPVAPAAMPAAAPAAVPTA